MFTRVASHFLYNASLLLRQRRRKWRLPFPVPRSPIFFKRNIYETLVFPRYKLIAIFIFLNYLEQSFAFVYFQQ